MNRLLAIALTLLWATTSFAQNFTLPPPAGVFINGFVVVSTCGAQSLTVGQTAYGTMLANGTLCDSGGGSGGGTNNVNLTQWNSVAVGSPTAYGTAPTGNAPGINAYVTNLATTSAGALIPPTAGTANRTITKTSLTANTVALAVCPTVTNPVSVEVSVSVAAVGLGINNQSLTSAAYGTATTNPDIILPSAGSLYTFPIPPTNAISAYSANAGIVICIQTTKS